MRSFLAVLLPETVRVALGAAAAGLQEGASRVAWVRTENLHLTLRFLGLLDEAALARVGRALETAAAGTAPFRVTFAGLGGFPSARAPRVVWAGVGEGTEALASLHARLDRALAGEGIPPEGRPFHPHVTLGRARDPRGEPLLGPHLAVPRGALGEMRAEVVHLMRSDLGPGGTRYRVLAVGVLRRLEHSSPVDFSRPHS